MWTRLIALISRLRFVALRRRIDTEAGREFDAHLELLVDRYVRMGMTPEEARVAARRQFGSVLLVREEIHQMNGIGWFERVSRDIRLALRLLIGKPGFSAAAIATLALGIGATIAVFSVVNGVLLRPLPYPAPERLVTVLHSATFQGMTLDTINLSSTMYLSYQKHNATFEQFGVWQAGAASVTGFGAPEEVRTLVVTYGTLPALGVRPALGRWFSREDDAPGTAETVILTHGYWMRRFGGDRGVIGQAVTIDSRSREVIGVMPEGFRFLMPERIRVLQADPDVILPQRFSGDQLRPNDVHAYWGIARLRPGVSLAQVSADVARMLPIWIGEYGTNRKTLEAARFAPALRPLKEEVVGDIGTVLWVLMGGISLVLLIACANVGNLLLVRAEGRQQELAVRAALGAGWRQIARQLLVESLTLGVLAGVAGLGLAFGGIRLLESLAPVTLPRLADISIDLRVWLFALAVSLFTGLLFGLIPVVRYAGPGVSRALGAVLHAGRAIGPNRVQQRSRGMLVIVQVALATVLLVASGLMLRSFQLLRDVQPGFSRPEQVQTLRISIPETQAPEPERVLQMQREIVEKIAAIPGVTSVSFATALPMETEFQNNMVVTVVDRTYEDGIPRLRRSKAVAPGFFATLGTPLVAGRDFTWSDLHDRRGVVIISERLARELWRQPSAALGKRIRVGRAGPPNEIVGVAGDVYDSGVHEETPAIAYWRAGPTPDGSYVPRAVTFAIRSSRTGTEGFVDQVGEAVWAVNPNLPLARLQTLGEVYERSMSRTSFALTILAIAGSMALLLGIVGLYGAISYAVSQRTRELGIRVALGAQRRDLRQRFVRDGAVLAGIGAGLGLGAAAALMRLMSSLLFGVGPLDPATYVAVPLVLTMAAVLATYLPIRRASAVDPLEALRAE